jgi:hypothetical protein
MGYFDAITSSYFKTAPGGQRLFFPWTSWGSGYVLASNEDYDRLRRKLRNYWIGGLLLIAVANVAVAYLGGFLVAALLIGIYAVWIRYLVRGLQRSAEKMTMRESMTSQASALSPVRLWLLEILALAFVAMGIFLIVVDRQNWLIGAALIVCFGGAAANFVWMMVQRRRAGGQ